MVTTCPANPSKAASILGRLRRFHSQVNRRKPASNRSGHACAESDRTRPKLPKACVVLPEAQTSRTPRQGRPRCPPPEGEVRGWRCSCRRSHQAGSAASRSTSAWNCSRGASIHPARQNAWSRWNTGTPSCRPRRRARVDLPLPGGPITNTRCMDLAIASIGPARTHRPLAGAIQHARMRHGTAQLLLHRRPHLRQPGAGRGRRRPDPAQRLHGGEAPDLHATPRLGPPRPDVRAARPRRDVGLDPVSADARPTANLGCCISR